MYDNNYLFNRILSELSSKDAENTLIIYLKKFFGEMDQNLQKNSLEFLAERFKIAAELLNLGENLYAAENPNTLPEVLDSIAKSVLLDNGENYRIFKAITKNSNTSYETLEHIIKMCYKYKKHDLISQIVLDPNASPEILDYLVRECSVRYSVLSDILKNPNIFTKTLKCIVDDYRYVDMCVESRRSFELLCQHPNINGEILHMLSQKYSKTPDNTELMAFIAESPKAFTKTLVDLVKVRNVCVHWLIATNPNISDELEYFVDHTYVGILCSCIISDPSTRSHILKKLALHKSKRVQRALSEISDVS